MSNATPTDGSPPEQLSELLCVDRLTQWMDDRGLGSGQIDRMALLAGGTQNVLVRFARGTDEYVLRRGPRRLRPKTNVHLEREMRVVGALGVTDVPHPRVIATCLDDSVIGSYFYLMEPVRGVNPAVTVPGALMDDAVVGRNFADSVVEAIVELGRVDYQEVGLGDLGKPDGFLERQPERWISQLTSYDSIDQYSRDSLVGAYDIAQWLGSRVPQRWTAGILHGDYHVGNVMVDETGEVIAVVDWEMSTIGDPLLDLGWLVATWPSSDRIDVIGSEVGRVACLPDPDALVERYADRSGRDLADFDWYVVLACFKLAAVIEGTYARSLVGHAPSDVGRLLHERAQVLMHRALHLIHA